MTGVEATVVLKCKIEWISFVYLGLLSVATLTPCVFAIVCLTIFKKEYIGGKVKTYLRAINLPIYFLYLNPF